jgi:phage regulator Rha-like protein
MDLFNTSGTSAPTNTAIAVPLDLITMTSREIADLTGKRHDNVKRTIETLAERGIIQLPQIEEVKDNQSLSPNNKTTVYVFSGEKGKRDSIVIVAQLSPEFTARLVDRWQELEAQVAIQSPIVKPYRIAADQLKCELEIRLLFECPKHLAQIESVKQVHKDTGVDYSPALLYAPAQQNILPEQEMFEPTEISERLGISSAIKVNKLLKDKGLQIKVGNDWEATDLVPKGMVIKHAWKKDGKSGYNLKWNFEFVKKIIQS